MRTEACALQSLRGREWVVEHVPAGESAQTDPRRGIIEPEAFDAKNGKAGARRRRRRAGGADRSARGPDILREEREALQRIRTAIEAWDKYEIVDRPGRAEMLIAIRKGRHGSVGGVSFSSPDDMLEALSPELTFRGPPASKAMARPTAGGIFERRSSV